ncbi:MAG: hypothetical protein HKP55_08170 [Gammaproteobacteria bacterium]|nr:hypothetical protein [Gammaproteobacteria bacterium]
MDSLFTSEDNFRTAFTEGLKDMLAAEQLGAFILVLANASYDKRLFSEMKSVLKQRFDHWSEYFASADFDENLLAPDDVAVFRGLLELGFDNIRETEKRMAGIWQLQYNPMRAFRPRRNADSKFDSNRLDYDAQLFNFNKPFLKKEIFWEGDFSGHQLRLLYNKFPFADLHGLLVIEPDKEKPQWLTQQDHEFVWQFLSQTGEQMPIGMGYSSLGGYASVNHQHFQTFVSKKKFPVELSCWEHNGGHLQYPLSCRKLFKPDEAWKFIDTLQQSNAAFNLLYRPDEVYCFSRAFQGSYAHAEWTPGFAWSETAGNMTVTSSDDFITLEEADIGRELQRLRR